MTEYQIDDLLAPHLDNALITIEQMFDLEEV